MSETQIQVDQADARPLEPGAVPVTALVLVAVVALAIALIAAPLIEGGLDRGLQRFAFSYLVAFSFVLSVALGSLFFVMATHLFRAGWAVAVRRPAEIFASSMPLVAAMSVPILLAVLVNNGMLYKWAQPIDQMGGHHGDEEHGDGSHAQADYVIVPASDAHGAEGAEAGQAAHETPHAPDAGREDPMSVGHGASYIEAKRPWLNVGFWVIRVLVYLLIWSVFGLWYFRTSTAQDSSGDPTLTNRMEGLAPLGVLVFAGTITFGSFDLLMSLDPIWYSTIFGVYFFAGSFAVRLATLILTLMFCQRAGYMKVVNVEHYHDLGKLQFAFVFFWGYIAFSQFMLIWYANLPDTIHWYDNRGATTAVGAANDWKWVTLALLFGNLLIPFAGLLSRHVKRNRTALAFWAVWILVMHWVDLWWIVMPQFTTSPGFPVVEIAAVVGLAALFLAYAALCAAGCSLVPVKDPRLGESLGFQNI